MLLYVSDLNNGGIRSEDVVFWAELRFRIQTKNTKIYGTDGQFCVSYEWAAKYAAEWSMAMRKHRGFTLVELLIVIAIIALLMSILMPALRRVQNQAKSAVCQTHLKHWGLIWSMYCHENDNRFCYAGSLGWKRGTWIIALRPQYETRSDIMRCPMAKARLPGVNHGGPFNSYRMGTGGLGDLREECSYGMNCWLYNPEPGQTQIQGRDTNNNWKTPYVKGASEVPVFADTMWRGGGPYETGTGGNPPQYHGEWISANREMMHFCIDRHGQGTANHLFMDWHVSKLGVKELWTLKWHRYFNTMGPWTTAGGVLPRDWPEWMKDFRDY